MVAHIDGRQRSLESGGARPLEGTDRTIRHKRRVRQGTTASIAVIAGGALATSGAVALKRAMEQEPAAYYLPEGGGVAVIDVDGPDPSVPDIGIQCGDPAPEPRLVDDGFELVTEVTEDEPWMSDYQSLAVRLSVTNTNEEQFPAFMLPMSVVATQNGVVVGIMPGGGLNNRLPFTPGRTSQSESISVGSWWERCDGAGYATAGTYELYAISTVANSPQIAGISSLPGAGGGAPVQFDGDQWLEPYDWECANEIIGGVSSGQVVGGTLNRSAACMPMYENVGWNAQERSLEIEYGDGRVSRVFSAQLVSEPFEFTIDRAPTSGGEDSWGEQPTQSSHLQCDLPMYWVDQPSATQSLSLLNVFSGELTGPHLGTEAQLAGEMWVEFGPSGVPARSATVSTGDRSRVYFTQMRDYPRDESSVWSRSEVVGWGWLTIADGDPVAVGRAVGPTSVDLEFQDVYWCAGEPPRVDMSVIAVGDFSVTSGAGTIRGAILSIYLGASTD
jgi:hypothetical protein